MADLDELMTDEVTTLHLDGRPERPRVKAAHIRNDFRAQLRPGYRALRESHDALEKLVRAEGWYPATPIEPYRSEWHRFDCNPHPTCTIGATGRPNTRCIEARAALAKAEALHG